MSQKNMSQIIVYKNQEELRSDIEEMIKEVEDIKKRIKIKQNEYEELFYNLNIDSARSVTASARRGMPGSYDISEKAKKDLSELHTDIKNMKNEAAAIRMSIKEKENDLRNVKKAAKSGTARGKSPISNNTSISNPPFVIIKNEISPKDAKYIIINDLDKRSSVASLKAINDHKQLDHMQSVNTLFAATKASSSATRASSSASGGASSSVSRASSSKSSSATRALSPAARRASSSASRASSSSSKTGGLRKRRGKNLDNTKTRK